MAFNVNVFGLKWNKSFQEKSIIDKITTTEFTTGQKAFERVTISAITGITVQDYVKGTAIAYEDVTSAETVILMNKQKLIAVIVEDIDEVQTNPVLLDGVIYEGVNKMTKEIETEVIAKLMADAVTNANTIAIAGVLTEATIKANLLTPARIFLNKANAPDMGRYIVVSAEDEALLQGLEITTTDTGLGTYFAGRTMGMDIFWSNNLPANTALVGVKEASAFGASLSKVKVLDSETQVGNALQILEVFGSGVVKAEGVAKVVITP